MLSLKNMTVVAPAVKDVLVTEIELDDDTGEYVREIRILGEGDALMFALQLRGEEIADIQFTTPELDY